VVLQKVVYKLLIVLSPSFSQKYFYCKFKTGPSRLFVALKELVDIFVLDNVSYLWTNEKLSVLPHLLWRAFLISK